MTLHADIQSSSAKIRWQALMRFYREHAVTPEDLPMLIELLADEHPGVRTYAVKVLRQLGEDALPILLDIFDQRPTTEQLVALIELIADYDDELVTMHLHQLFEHGYTPVQLAVIKAFNQRRNPVDLPLLLQALSDSNKYIRYQAILALTHQNLTSAPPEIIAALQDSDVLVRGTAIYLIGKIGDSNTIPALIETFRWAVKDASTPPIINRVAGQRLTQEELQKFTDSHGSTDLPVQAVYALARMGEPARPALETLVNDPLPKMRRCAAWALELME
jgi:HEAT repeat protein